MTYSSRDIDVIEGLEAIRRRPAMYIGEANEEHSLCSRLIEYAVEAFATAAPVPRAVRLIAWAGGAYTLATDGEPFPIRPWSMPPGSPGHPELYVAFMYLKAPSSLHELCAVVVNALSERLAVSTMHDGERYRASFRHGGLVALLAKSPLSEPPYGTNWITFKPDETIVTGALTIEHVRAIVERVAERARDVDVSHIDRSGEKPDWW